MAIESQRTLISRLSAQLAGMVDQADALDRPAEPAAPSMVSWLRGRFGLSPRDASRLVREVRGLRAAPVAAEAARFGAIPVESAAEIGHAVTALPAGRIRPLFSPPAWVDPRRRPRRNHTHHTRDLLRAGN